MIKYSFALSDSKRQEVDTDYRGGDKEDTAKDTIHGKTSQFLTRKDVCQQGC